MQKLKLRQEQFCLALIENKRDILAFIASEESHARLEIYRQNILANLSNTLSIIYPGIWQLIGEQCANEVSSAFAKNISYLPKPGEMDQWASHFPHFLQTVEVLKDLPYLSDYARFEWLQHLAYGAPNAPYLEINALDQIPETSLDSLKINFLPSVYFLDSSYPLDKIQQLLADPEAPAITLTDEGCNGVILRIEDEIKTLWLNKDLWNFMNALAKGETLEKSHQLAQTSFPDFDLTHALLFMFQQQMVFNLK